MENQNVEENQELKDKAQEEVTEAAQEENENVEELKTQKEEEDFKAKYFYLAAEMENQRKRFEREKENLVKYGLENVLRDLVEVVDNFERTVDMLKLDEDEKVKNIVFGIDMVRKQFLDVLGKSGLEQLETIGKTFDPNFHEALSSEEVEGKKEDEILKEHQKGYVLNGRLLRPSKVVVAK